MKKYTVLFAEISKKNPDDEPDVYRFESIKEFLSFVKKVKFQEKMNFNSSLYFIWFHGKNK
nr:hypothetical protein [Providencia stuartii]